MMVNAQLDKELMGKLWYHTDSLRIERSLQQRAPAILVDLESQFLTGPHASLCVSAPVITAETRKTGLLLAARFNIETSIRDYDTGQKYGNFVRAL
jgi:hypothetical protein